MFKSYTNFVQPSTSYQEQESSLKYATLSGEEAKRIYLNELKLAGVSKKRKHERNIEGDNLTSKIPHKTRVNQSLINAEVSDRDLYMSVQNNDVDTLKQALDICPDKINKVDDYGWSLLMIACQANSIEVVKELLERGVDTSVRDKAGNSAQSLIIKNKNYKLADTLLNYKNKRDLQHDNTIEQSNNCTKIEADNITNFFCEICNINVTTTRNIHLSSTIHNINLSKGKKIPTNYVIPETNKGFQIMLKVGWDKESGLGPDGAGTKYPIKTVQKQDRKGLGHGKRKATTKETEETVKLSKRSTVKENELYRRMEVNFRRQFY